MLEVEEVVAALVGENCYNCRWFSDWGEKEIIQYVCECPARGGKFMHVESLDSREWCENWVKK